jgi:hypothetical protein
MKTLFALACLLPLATTAGAQSALYDTFNEDDPGNLFDCCNALPVVGPKAGAPMAIAVPFVPAGAQRILHLTEIDVALSYTSGPSDELRVEIEGPTSPDGHPHRVQRKARATGIPAGGQCCAFSALDAGGLHLKSGDTYWVVVSSTGASVGGWNLASTGASGRYMTWDGKSWSATSGPLPALRLLGQ